jgi:hypothetical protein
MVLDTKTQKLLKGALDQALMIIGVLIGIVFSKAVLQKAEEGIVSNPLQNLTRYDLIIDLILALFITPYVYNNTLKLDPSLPFLIRFGLYLQAGVSYPIIFNNISG